MAISDSEIYFLDYPIFHRMWVISRRENVRMVILRKYISPSKRVTNAQGSEPVATVAFKKSLGRFPIGATIRRAQREPWP